jgi:hypothetical protein
MVGVGFLVIGLVCESLLDIVVGEGGLVKVGGVTTSMFVQIRSYYMNKWAGNP